MRNWNNKQIEMQVQKMEELEIKFKENQIQEQWDKLSKERGSIRRTKRKREGLITTDLSKVIQKRKVSSCEEEEEKFWNEKED